MRVLYAKSVYGPEEIEAVNDVLRNRPTALMGGPAVAEFESRVAALFGKAHGVMTNSGSSANTLAVASLGLPRGAEVITPVLTFSTTVASLVQQGLLPVFVDAEPDTYVIDVAEIEEMIRPETRAMLIPNLIGNLPDWRALRDIADRHGLALVEDSADTIGSRVGGAPTGRLSDISTTSFYATHVITCAGFGGAACFHDEELLRRAQLLRGWGRRSSLTAESEEIKDRFTASVDDIAYDSKFVFDLPGYNFMASELAAAFGLVQLGKLDRFLGIRARNFAAMRDFFKDYEAWFMLPRQHEDVRTGWLAFPLIVRDDAPFRRRDLQLRFESHGIQTRTVFTGNILRQPGFRDIARRESKAGYPNADRVMRGGMLLGCHQGMSEEDVAFVCETFREFARGR